MTAFHQNLSQVETLSKEDLNQAVIHLLNQTKMMEELFESLGYELKSTKKKRFVTKTQETQLRTLTRALCVETQDPWKQNRVRFFHPLLHDPNSTLFSLPFASPVSSMGGFDDCGLNWVPPAGSTIIVFFEGGSRDAAFYLGTTWHRYRGAGGQEITEIYPSREYQALYTESRGGYLVGKNDGSQCFPPWNTESYNGNDIDNFDQFATDPLEQKKATYPNIYGFKTPEKAMWKAVDGNAKCNRMHKRLEMLSGCGNWLIFKDDHIHYGGQWAHPSCNPDPGGDAINLCSEHESELPYFSDIQGRPIEKNNKCGDPVMFGKSSTPENKTNTGSNPYFKHANECRPYKGPGTPQNNKCDLPQSGIQFLSISGHTMVMDDSVEEPQGQPTWKRSLQDFDFGCTDKFMGRMYFASTTGHSLMFNDQEKETKLRGDKNYIKLLSASGNKIELNDETVGPPGDQECPPRYAGENRGIHLQSTSNHTIDMVDHMNLQCSPIRKSGGIPQAKASKAFIRIKSGYGLRMEFNDEPSQEQTSSQYIQITHPQCVDATKDNDCNASEEEGSRGPHFLKFQGRPKGEDGVVFLRAGGHSIRSTYSQDLVFVGDKEKNPSDKFTYVSKRNISASEDVDFRYSGKSHVLFAEKQILLLAGRDCPPKQGKKCPAPCTFPVVIARCPKLCPITNILHWTEQAISERVFASGNHPCQGLCGGGCDSYGTDMAKAGESPCTEKDNDTLDANLQTMSEVADEQ